jgi:hypothetical protein
LLNIRWLIGIILLLSVCRQFGGTLSLNIRWQLWEPLIAYTETIELVAFIRLEGVNYVFSQVSLILVATFLSSIFAKSLHTNFFAPFLAARESNFCPVSHTSGTPSWYIVHAPPYFSHRTRGFLEARCSWEHGS